MLFNNRVKSNPLRNQSTNQPIMSQDHPETFKKIASYIKEHCIPRRGNVIIVPIKKIDDIPVIVTFTYEGSNQEINYLTCIIELAPKIGYNMAEFIVRDFDDEFPLEKGIKLIFEKIEKLKYNKTNGLFYDHSKNDGNSVEENIMVTMFSILKNYENATSSISECCVCLEITETHTSCGHNVCIACYSKLDVSNKKWSEYYGKDLFHKKCPLCRGIIQKLLPERNYGDIEEQLGL